VQSKDLKGYKIMICNLSLDRMNMLLNGLSRLVSEKLPHQGAGSIRLEADADAGRLILSANNGKMVVRRSVDATVGLSGAVVVPLVTLAQWVSIAASWIEGETEVYLTDKDIGKRGHALELFIDQPRTEQLPLGMKHTARFWTQDPDVFATFDIPEIEMMTVLSQRMLEQEIAHVTWAGSHADDGVGRLGGVNMNIHPADQVLSLVAADGFRVGRTSVEHASLTSDEESFLLPLSALDAIPGLLWSPDTVTPVEVGVDANRARVYFWSEQTMVGVHIMDLDYPDIERLLERFSAPQVSLTINREQLADFVRRIARYASTTAKGSLLSPTVTIYAGPAEDWTVTVSSKMTSLNGMVFDDSPLYAGRETIVCRDVAGDVETEIKCNAVYLSEALQTIDEAEIRMEMRGNREPISFRSLDAEKTWVSYVMPMGKG
jgi:DNA polymerase III sliding clamp (beta) subunit (PCNA family)